MQETLSLLKQRTATGNRRSCSSRLQSLALLLLPEGGWDLQHGSWTSDTMFSLF